MCRYLQIPAELLSTELSPRAILAYALISARWSLSELNNWQSDRGIYCLYSRASLSKDLSISTKQAGRLIDELARAQLIVRDGKRLYRGTASPQKGTKMSLRGDKNVPTRGQKCPPIYNNNNYNNRYSYRQQKIPSGYGAAYDISDYEATDITDEFDPDQPPPDSGTADPEHEEVDHNAKI